MLYPPDLKPDLACTADSVCRPRQISWIRTFRVCQPCLRNSSSPPHGFTESARLLLSQSFQAHHAERRYPLCGVSLAGFRKEQLRRRRTGCLPDFSLACRGLAEKSGTPLGGPRPANPKRVPILRAGPKSIESHILEWASVKSKSSHRRMAGRRETPFSRRSPSRRPTVTSAMRSAPGLE